MKLVVITFIFSILMTCNNDASGVRVKRGEAKKIDTDSLSYDAVVFSSSPYCGNNETSSGPISEASFGEEESDVIIPKDSILLGGRYSTRLIWQPNPL